MKRLFMALSMGVVIFSTSFSWAIVVNGIVDSGEWDSYYKFQDTNDVYTPPDETNIQWLWLGSGPSVVFRFDTLADPAVTYEYSYCPIYLDFNNDGSLEYSIYFGKPGWDTKLRGLTIAQVYRWTSPTTGYYIGDGQAACDEIIEIEVPGWYFSDYAPLGAKTDVWVQARVDNNDGPADDTIGWLKTDITVTPEPSTMALVGLGIAGLAARRRKK